MPYFIDRENSLHFLESNNNIHLLPEACRAVEESEVFLYSTQETEETKLSKLKSLAMARIRETDTVMLRCLKRGVEFDESWRMYYATLLEIVRLDSYSEEAEIPPAPPYPVGS